MKTLGWLPGRGVSCGVLFFIALAAVGAEAAAPETIRFESGDGQTKLVAYLYKPAAPAVHAAVVALHGRSGLYTSGARHYGAETLSSRHRMWGEFWAARNVITLLVDTFGPRGYPAGFAAGTIRSRPPEIHEITARPLDAFAGLRYLRSRADVARRAVFLQGWSNGGSAALSAMAIGAPGLGAGERGFRAALALYPACTRVLRHYGDGYKTYAPVRLLIGTDDEEVRPGHCAVLGQRAKANGSDFEFVLYQGATHSYDTPIPSRQRVAANAFAATDTKRRAEEFLRAMAGPQ